VTLPGGALVGRVGGQALGGVLPQQLVHAVAAVLADLDQGLVDQRAEQWQGGAGHGGRRVQVEAAPQHREAGEHEPLLVGEELPGPVDHRAQAAVASLDIGRAGREQVQPAAEPVGDGGRGRRPHPAGSQLDGERHPGEQPAEAGDIVGIGGQAEARPDQARPRLEEPHRLVAGRLLSRRRVGQAGHLDQPLRAEAEAPPRGGQDLHAWRPQQQFGHHLRGVAELLEVVEHQQQLAAGEMVAEQLERVARHRERDPERGGHGRDHQVALPLGPARLGPDERDEGDSVAVAAPPGGGDLHRQPRLADPAGTDQGHQPAGWVVEQLVEARQLRPPADHRGERLRQVGARPARRPVLAGQRLAQRHEATAAGDLVAQSQRRRRRLGRQLLAQDVAAGLELGEGGAALAAFGQEPHQRALGLLVQRLQPDKAAGDLDPSRRVPVVPDAPHRLVHQSEHRRPAGGAACHQPVVEQRGAGEPEAVEQVPAAKPRRGQQLAGVDISRGSGEPLHLESVDPDRPAGRERHRLAVGVEEAGERPAQLGEDQAQVGPCGRLGQVAPEQPGQRRA
jgi:hypothetical protein